MTAMKAKYDKAEVNINKICGALESHQITLLKDVALLDKMYELNLSYFKELTMYILAGKKKAGKRSVPQNYLHLLQKLRPADWLKMHRLPEIWMNCAIVLRKNFTTWILPVPLPCRLLRRSV